MSICLEVVLLFPTVVALPCHNHVLWVLLAWLSCGFSAAFLTLDNSCIVNLWPLVMSMVAFIHCPVLARP